LSGPDLSKLSIDRSAAGAPRARRRLWPWIAGLALLAAAAALGLAGGFGGPVTVETAAVATAYPSQAVTALNATGYRRRAAQRPRSRRKRPGGSSGSGSWKARA
jgi:hypothetical protein